MSTYPPPRGLHCITCCGSFVKREQVRGPSPLSSLPHHSLLKCGMSTLQLCYSDLKQSSPAYCLGNMFLNGNNIQKAVPDTVQALSCCCLVAQLCPTLLRPHRLQPARLLWWLSGKEFACSARDASSIRGSGEENDNLLKYSCLGIL